MVLNLRREGDESWTDAARRLAARYGLVDDVLREVERRRSEGEPEADAVWNACFEWGVLESVDASWKGFQGAQVGVSSVSSSPPGPAVDP